MWSVLLGSNELALILTSSNFLLLSLLPNLVGLLFLWPVVSVVLLICSMGLGNGLSYGDMPGTYWDKLSFTVYLKHATHTKGSVITFRSECIYV